MSCLRASAWAREEGGARGCAYDSERNVIVRAQQHQWAGIAHPTGWQRDYYLDLVRQDGNVATCLSGILPAQAGVSGCHPPGLGLVVGADLPDWMAPPFARARAAVARAMGIDNEMREGSEK